LAATLVAELRELGTTDHRRISALVGVAPFANDSGRTNGPRAIRGGRTDVRCALYMATLTAARHHPVIKALSDGLRWDQLNVANVTKIA
jgi:transposase